MTWSLFTQKVPDSYTGSPEGLIEVMKIGKHSGVYMVLFIKTIYTEENPRRAGIIP